MNWGLVFLVAGGAFTTVLQLLTLGAVPAVVTGLVLWWLLARFPQRGMATAR